MPGAGRSSRGGGKRTASASASACVYYATTGVFVALCVAGGYFYTKTSTASAEVQATVTAFRHTTRSSFAHEVPKAVATLQQREVTVDEPQGGIVEHASHLGSAKEEVSKNAAAGVGKPEGEVAEHVAGEANAEKDVKKDVAASEDAGVKAQEAEEKPQEAAQAEVQQPQEQEQQPKPQQEEDGGGDVGVKEKVLDGGVEEETRELQLPHEDEPAARDEQANGTGDNGSMRREAQEDPQGDGEETTEQQPAREEPQGEGMETTEQQPASEETHGDGEERAEQKPEEEDSDDVGSRKEGEQNASVSEAGDTDQSLEESRGDGKPTVTEQEKEALDGGHAGLNDHPHVLDSLTDESHTEASGDVTGEQKAWATQAYQSEREKDRREEERANSNSNNATGGGGEVAAAGEYEWRLCNVRTGADYIPCLDNEKAIKQLKTENYRRYEHRERHCPEESPTCLVALPAGYRRPIEWPKSRDRIWYSNVPHTKLVDVKGHQNWVKVADRYLTFPGGGTQFIHGALHYIDFLQQSVRGIAWGKHTRVVLDVGCGVASFGGYLFDREVVTISFAPKDEHEAQVQMALERGIPAISAVMGSKRLQFPSKVFDLVHCARCRVPWHADGGALLLELNRVLRPGGFFVWSATPVYQKLEEDVEIWRAMSALTKSMCWELVTIKKDRLNGIGAAFYRKPTSNECYETRRRQNPPMCSDEDDPNAAWYIRLNACMHSVPTDKSERGASWPEVWPRRLRTPPYWLNSSQAGVYGKAAPEDFTADYEHWRRVIGKSYLTGFGIDWSRVRNVMDMRAAYGGFAASLRDQKVWVMNVVNVDAPDTLPIIFERGLFGIYHDWCESFSTYPRTYDLLHADHLFSRIKDRCPILPVVVEVDRIVRPGGKVIVRDESDTVGEVEKVLRSLHWDVRLTFSKDNEGIVFAEKSDWRPELLAEPS